MYKTCKLYTQDYLPHFVKFRDQTLQSVMNFILCAEVKILSAAGTMQNASLRFNDFANFDGNYSKQ